MNKEELRALIEKYFVGDKHEWPDWMSLNPRDGEHEVRYDYDSSKLCYSLIRHFKPTSVFECGTSFGHSAILITDALRKNGLPFRFVTFELEESIYQAAKRNLEQRHGELIPELIHGDVMQHPELIPEEIDFAFIDTNHEAESTIWYINNIFPRLKDGALVAIHDFPVVEDGDGNWVTKDRALGVYPETDILITLHKEGLLPLEPIYLNYMNPLYEGDNPLWEASFWTYRKPKQ